MDCQEHGVRARITCIQKSSPGADTQRRPLMQLHHLGGLRSQGEVR